MKFPYHKILAPVRNGKGAKKAQLTPYIKIGVFNKEKYTYTLALIDSGAQHCLFPAEIGEVIGLENIERGHKIDFVGIAQK